MLHIEHARWQFGEVVFPRLCSQQCHLGADALVVGANNQEQGVQAHMCMWLQACVPCGALIQRLIIRHARAQLCRSAAVPCMSIHVDCPLRFRLCVVGSEPILGAESLMLERELVIGLHVHA